MSLRGVNYTKIWIDEVGYPTAQRRIATFTKESNIFGEALHYANPIMYSFTELNDAADWCYETFGHPGYNQETKKTVWNYQSDPDYVFWFDEEKHLMMFILRWS